MPFALTTIGLLLIVVGFQNTYKEFGAQVIKDFSGPGNFIYWLIAIGVVGALGYNKTLEPFSRAFMGLIIVVLFLSNEGFFAKLNPAIEAGTSTQPLPIGGLPTQGSGGKKSGGLFGGLGSSVGDLFGGGGGSDGFDLGDAAQVAIKVAPYLL